MWFFKKRRQARKHPELIEQELEEAKRRWEEFHKSLPKEFTLSSPCRCGERISPDFHFTMDPYQPGLYRAPFNSRTWPRP